jgi:hypothetical protein
MAALQKIESVLFAEPELRLADRNEAKRKHFTI